MGGRSETAGDDEGPRPTLHEEERSEATASRSHQRLPGEEGGGNHDSGAGKGSGAFTDYFVVCSGTNPRQIQAISDEVEERLEKSGLRPTHVEGYKQAEWVLLDYVDFVVHIFSEKARKYYDLERLWKSAKRLAPSEAGAGSRVKRSSGHSVTRKPA